MNRSFIMKTVVLGALIFAFLLQNSADAQLPRERVEKTETVDNLFWGTTNIGIETVKTIHSNNLSSTILHTFGLVGGGIDRFYGLDDGANTRIGLNYGFTSRFSAGIGRMTFNKVVDLRAKYKFLRQTRSGSMPLDLAAKVSTGINTTSGMGFQFSDRLSYLISVMAARKFDRFSLQLTPMMAHFNHAEPGNHNQLFGLGILANYALNDRFAISTEYLPVIGNRNTGTHDAMAVALNIDTGGHLFQVFLASSQWHNEQFIMAKNRDRFWKGDFRLGFNINRVFGL